MFFVIWEPTAIPTVTPIIFTAPATAGANDPPLATIATTLTAASPRLIPIFSKLFDFFFYFFLFCSFLFVSILIIIIIDRIIRNI